MSVLHISFQNMVPFIYVLIVSFGCHSTSFPRTGQFQKYPPEFVKNLSDVILNQKEIVHCTFHSVARVRDTEPDYTSSELHIHPACGGFQSLESHISSMNYSDKSNAALSASKDVVMEGLMRRLSTESSGKTPFTPDALPLSLEQSEQATQREFNLFIPVTTHHDSDCISNESDAFMVVNDTAETKQSSSSKRKSGREARDLLIMCPVLTCLTTAIFLLVTGVTESWY